MSLTIEPIDAALGAFVTGIDLSNLEEETWRQVECAFHEFALLIFPGQHPGADAQIAFAERFGTIEYIAAGRKTIPITNRREDGTLMDDSELGMELMRGNEYWHTDSSYMPVSAKASVFSAHIVPSSGGQTEWADMRAAYDALDEDTRKRISDLSAYHSIYRAQHRIGHKVAPGASYGMHNEAQPPLRPLVKYHPVTGRPSLYIGRHAYGIPGLDPNESEKLLDDLVAFACRAPRTYMHNWQAGDIVVWDNRCLLHRARPYNHNEPRLMQHTRVAGDPATESALDVQQAV